MIQSILSDFAFAYSSQFGPDRLPDLVVTRDAFRHMSMMESGFPRDDAVSAHYFTASGAINILVAKPQITLNPERIFWLAGRYHVAMELNKPQDAEAFKKQFMSEFEP